MNMMKLSLSMMLLNITLIGCHSETQKRIDSLVSETILYQLNGVIWEYDLSVSQNNQLISLHNEEDSAVFDASKEKIIYDTFDPKSATKSHKLYYTDYPIQLSQNLISGSSNIAFSDPSVCINTNTIVAIKSELDISDHRNVLNNYLIEQDINGNETNNYGIINLDAFDLRCSRSGTQIIYSNFNRSSGNSNVLLYNTSTGDTLILTDPSKNCDSQSWSPDDQWIYATCSGSLYKMRPFLDSITNFAAEKTLLLPATNNTKFYGPLASPMGTHIVVEQYDSGDDGKFIIDLASNAKTKTNIPLNAVLTDWR